MTTAEPADTRIGSVLLAMGILPASVLATSLIEASARGVLLGCVLVDRGAVSAQDVRRAAELQDGLRSPKRKKRALAVADVAISASQRTAEHATKLRESSAELRRSSTGKVHRAVMD